MTSPIQNTGQPNGLLSHHAEAEPNETALGPDRSLINADANVVHSNDAPGHSQHANPHIGGGNEPAANGQPPGGNAPGQPQTMGPNGSGNGPHGFGHSQHGDNGLGPGNQGNPDNGLGNGIGTPGNGVSNGFGPQGNQGNGLGNGFGNLGGNGVGNGGFGSSGLWGGNNGNGGLGGFLGNTLGGLLGGSSSASGALASLGNVAGIVQNTVGFVQNTAQNPVGSTLYTVNESVAQRSRPAEPIVDSDPGGSRAPVRSDSPGTTTSTSDRPPSGSETNVFVRAASSDTSINVPAAPRPTSTNSSAPANTPAPEAVVREPVALARAPANASETVVTRADNATLSSSSAADRTSTPLLNGTAAPAQNAGELGVVARIATPLTLIAMPPLAGEGETVAEVGRMALFRADAGDGRESVQDIYGRNYVVYAGDGRNVDKPGNDRAIRAIGTPNVDALEQSRVSNHGELSTHELIWKTVVPALVGVGALFGGASAAGLAVASSGSAGPALLAAATAIFGYGALRASLALRDRAQSGEPTNPLQNAQARRDWIAAGANSAGVLASLALMIA